MGALQTYSLIIGSERFMLHARRGEALAVISSAVVDKKNESASLWISPPERAMLVKFRLGSDRDDSNSTPALRVAKRLIAFRAKKVSGRPLLLDTVRWGPAPPA
jgi:hypothetical protein